MVVEVVRDAAGELAHRLHLLRLARALLELRLVRDVAQQDDARGPARIVVLDREDADVPDPRVVRAERGEAPADDARGARRPLRDRAEELARRVVAGELLRGAPDQLVRREAAAARVGVVHVPDHVAGVDHDHALVRLLDDRAEQPEPREVPLLRTAVAQDRERRGRAVEDGGRRARLDRDELAVEAAQGEAHALGAEVDVGAAIVGGEALRRGDQELAPVAPQELGVARGPQEVAAPRAREEDALPARHEDRVGRRLDQLAELLAALAERPVRALEIGERGVPDQVVGEDARAAHDERDEADAVEPRRAPGGQRDERLECAPGERSEGERAGGSERRPRDRRPPAAEHDREERDHEEERDGGPPAEGQEAGHHQVEEDDGHGEVAGEGERARTAEHERDGGREPREGERRRGRSRARPSARRARR